MVFGTWIMKRIGLVTIILGKERGKIMKSILKKREEVLKELDKKLTGNLAKKTKLHIEKPRGYNLKTVEVSKGDFVSNNYF